MSKIRLQAMNTSTTPLPTIDPAHSLDMGISGMTSASCEGRVERALRKLPGVQHATVNLDTESARIAFVIYLTISSIRWCSVRIRCWACRG